MTSDLNSMLAHRLRALAADAGNSAELAESVYRMLELERQAKVVAMGDEETLRPLYSRHRRNLKMVSAS